MKSIPPPSDSLPFAQPLRETLVGRLGQISPKRLEAAGRSRAAVMLTIVSGEGGEAAVLLTRRGRHLRRHRGQFALPGGRLDPGEGTIEAGLRELREELGVRLEERDVLGRLDDFPTRSGWIISPIVAWANHHGIQADPGEVAAVYQVPIEELASPEALRNESFFADEGPVPALDLASVGTLVFAPTAAILHQFAELAAHGRYAAVAHFAQPSFTHS